MKNAAACFLLCAAVLAVEEKGAFEDARGLTMEELALRFPPETGPEGPQYYECVAPRGVVVLVHGLNVRPSKLGAPGEAGTLAALFLGAGYNVLRVTLAGHDSGAPGSTEEMRTVSAARWLADGLTQYGKAAQEARRRDLPLFLAAFSLGALVFEALMNEDTETPVRFDKAVLFAPAVAIKPAARAVLFLRPFSGGTIIASASPAAYRAQRGASVNAYKAVFDLTDALKTAAFAHSNTDTLVFIDPDDEFVSAGGLRKVIAKNGLTNWRITEISNKGAGIRPAYHHLIIDNKCVSPAAWENIAAQIIAFLEEK